MLSRITSFWGKLFEIASKPLTSSLTATKSFSNGNTTLHNYAKKPKSLADIQRLMAKRGLEKVAQMATTTNDEGQLPLDIIYKTQTISDLPAYEDVLFPLMTPKGIKPLTELLSVDAILNRYAHLNDPLLNENLWLGAAVANATRAVIKESLTHPDSNVYSVDEQRRLHKAIVAMRQKIDYQALILGPHCTADFAEKFGIGNCEEFAYVALKKLGTFNKKKVVGEIFTVEGGDHVITLLGNTKSEYHPSHWKWSKTQVVCDAWLGDVYLASEMKHKLTTYRYYKRDELFLNVLSTFNSNCHRLERIRMQTFPEKEKSIFLPCNYLRR